MLAFSESTVSNSPVNKREKEIMRRSSVNPFAFKNSILENIQEENEQVRNNPFQSVGMGGGFKNKLSVSSQESEGMQNPFMNINKKTTNPFEAKGNPFQSNPFSGNPFQAEEKVNPIQVEERDEEVEGLFKKLSLKIEVKDKGQNVCQNMVFLEENQKRQILKILKPFLTSELNGPNAEMVMKINSRKNSVEKIKSLVQSEVQQILEESEPSEKESKVDNVIVLPEQEISKEVPMSNLVIHKKKIDIKPSVIVQKNDYLVQPSSVQVKSTFLKTETTPNMQYTQVTQTIPTQMTQNVSSQMTQNIPSQMTQHVQPQLTQHVQPQLTQHVQPQLTQITQMNQHSQPQMTQHVPTQMTQHVPTQMNQHVPTQMNQHVPTQITQVPEDSNGRFAQINENSQVQLNSNTQVQMTQMTRNVPVQTTQTTQYSQTKTNHPSHHVENFQYSRPIVSNKPVEIQPRVVSTEIKEQSNYQYIPQSKPQMQYEMSPNYQANFANPNFNKTKDFRLKSVIRSITTTKRPSQVRDTYPRESYTESVTNQFQPNFEESSHLLNTHQNSQLFVEGHSSYIKLQSNKFQDSQIIGRDPTEMDYASNLPPNYASHLISEGYTMQTNPMDSLNQTQEINQNKDDQKIELTTLIQKNRLEQTIQDDEGRTSDRIISKKFQSTDPNQKKKMQTYSTHQTQIDSVFGERLTHDPSSIPVNRNVLLGGLKSKPVKRSFTNGLRIFRKVKDSQGNIVKENMEHSINIYSNKILKNLKSKKETQETEDGTRNYKTLLYTSSTLNPTLNPKGLVSDRVISSQKNENIPLLYTSSRNIEERKQLSNPRPGNNHKLATSIFYSETKTEQNSARNSNLKTHYVRSTRVSPAITVGSRTQGIYSKFLIFFN